MKKIVFFCLIIFCSICSNAETWREFFCKQISQNIDNYPSKADFESFKEIQNKDIITSKVM